MNSVIQDPARNILVVEDDASLASLLRKRLEADRYRVDVANDGESGVGAALRATYDLLILDLNLPKIDGMSLLRQVRPSRPRMPVLVLTGRTSLEDRVSSLDSGADDCLLKPFSFLELSARVRALMRRSSDTRTDVFRIADLIVDCQERHAERAGKRINLSKREFDVLECLVRNSPYTVTRTMLSEAVWNMPFDPTVNLANVYIKYVRDKVDGQHDLKLIRTVRNVGYVLAEN